MELKRVVVTGLGAITPVGNDVKTTWDSLIKGVSGAGPITLFDASKFKTRFACEVKNFDPNEHIDRKEARKMDRYTQLAVVAAKEAIEDSGIAASATTDKDRVGVVISSGIGGIGTFEQEVGSYFLHPEMGPRLSPFFIPKMIGDIAAGQISILYGLRGPNFGTVSACASSTNGAITAFDMIRLGKVDAVVTGGAEAAVTVSGVGGFNAMNALSTRNESPATASRPFSASRDGFVIGEGSAVMVLEEMEHALARGAKIYAEIAGGGASGDAYHLTASHPEGLGAMLVMKNALLDANMSPSEIGYINVHGTSTPVGDPSEAKAIKEIFGEHAYKLNISSTKSMTGHMLGAAGAVETMACILAVQNNIIPPTINHEPGDNDPEIDYNLNFTFNNAEKREISAALSNTFGFGGHNACIIVKKFVR
ncbi:MAG: beta-ketoacyl-ACP synthase II [Dysgonamonadaceae bacterium]|jgi:3-oxoacyl-[acyl-carrier-protein] synthase II|nr:beta-ketoacyl-ACP synthase II [Dysgonamonadaceae bacterium]